MMPNNFSEEKRRKFWCGDCGISRDDVNHFAALVHYHEYGVQTRAGTRELSDQVHADQLPAARRVRDGLKEPRWVIVAGFD